MKKLLLFINALFFLFINKGVNASNLIYRNDNTNYKIYLTFDDGYSYKNTACILDTLKDKKVSVTFFLEGGFLDQCPLLVNRMVNEGHIVANHTWSHKTLDKMSLKDIDKEFELFENRYEEITGLKLIKYFRPPQGVIDIKKITHIESLGYKVFLWSVNYYDYNPYHELGTKYAVNYITNNTTAGDIILMHTLVKCNATALGQIIDNLRNKGYEFASLSSI